MRRRKHDDIDERFGADVALAERIRNHPNLTEDEKLEMIEAVIMGPVYEKWRREGRYVPKW